MTLKRGDFVKILNKNNLEGKVVGFYPHTQDAVIETPTGHQWIISPIFLEKVVDNNNKK